MCGSTAASSEQCQCFKKHRLENFSFAKFGLLRRVLLKNILLYVFARPDPDAPPFLKCAEASRELRVRSFCELSEVCMLHDAPLSWIVFRVLFFSPKRYQRFQGLDL